DQNPPMDITEKNSPTFLSTGNPCLDFFFHVVPDTPSETLVQRLQLAWSHDPLTTLKLVFNLRGVCGTGKSDRESFYNAALWLHQHHPRTLASNVPSLAADFGYFKDLPEILYRLLEGSS
ncbi:plant/T31B5-30 protein, partial [Trifolium medium]|nr:plant/T31B5-30 protein [Trifolium medium]